jgi:hypothetical protein
VRNDVDSMGVTVAGFYFAIVILVHSFGQGIGVVIEIPTKREESDTLGRIIVIHIIEGTVSLLKRIEPS